MARLKLIVYIVLILLVAIAAGVFSARNPGSIAIDVGFFKFDEVSKPLAFAITLALGWLLGLVSAALALIKSAGQKRRLSRNLRIAEAEVASLRSLPLNDAD